MAAGRAGAVNIRGSIRWYVVQRRNRSYQTSLTPLDKAGWVGKGKDTHKPAEDHVSRPLATLKDPDSFGPPPKNVNYHGGAAIPDAITPDRRGLGAPLSTEEIWAQEQAERREAQATAEAAKKPAPPPVPYRMNTSGLSTSNLPKPPVRRLDQGDQSPASPVRPFVKPKPTLPPRPPRQGSTPLPNFTTPPPPYSAKPDTVPSQGGGTNPGAANRLASAGVSVPGFGIGVSPQNTHQTNGNSTPPMETQGPSVKGPQLSELQSRFSKLSTNSQDTAPPSQGTCMADKQAALRTAQSFHNDPSSVSLSDARNTAATANNFRERHGDQVNAGLKSANALNKKYDIANRASSYASQNGTSSEAQQSPSSPIVLSSTSTPLHKRAPPPPPQKPSFGGGSTTSPPPVPLSSKPR
ncbi:MAG: hypothetical protein L6R40_000832 [Gallowayella cf. fulva]|nr:MAG: hypothetical protein L6R40_000832 [Xanthomendoza cf. fulva]